MKLTVLLGPAGSGNTSRSLPGLRPAERRVQRRLLLLPDQFTDASDRPLLEDENLAGTRYVARMSYFAHAAREFRMEIFRDDWVYQMLLIAYDGVVVVPGWFNEGKRLDAIMQMADPIPLSRLGGRTETGIPAWLQLSLDKERSI